MKCPSYHIWHTQFNSDYKCQYQPYLSEPVTDKVSYLTITKYRNLPIFKATNMLHKTNIYSAELIQEFSNTIQHKKPAPLTKSKFNTSQFSVLKNWCNIRSNRCANISSWTKFWKQFETGGQRPKFQTISHVILSMTELFV